MLPVRNYKKCLIKPLPLDKIIKTKSPTFRVSSPDGQESVLGYANDNNKRFSLTKNDPKDSPLDYTIDESDDEDKINFNSSQYGTPGNGQRKSFSSTNQRNITSTPSNLKDLLKPSPLEFVKKRKRKPPITPTALQLTPTKAFDGIDESSPIKRIKVIPFSDQSSIFINRNKKTQNSKKLDKQSSSSHSTLVDQVRCLMEKERTSRNIWRHSVTSQLKNKFKETVRGRDTLTLKLSNFQSKFHLGFANGLITETTVPTNYKVGETVRLIFPSAVCESMGLANGLIVRFISPWNVIIMKNHRFVINPFWITVVERVKGEEKGAKTTITEEVTLVEWTCPCQESFGAIDPLECNLALSQRSQPKSQV